MVESVAKALACLIGDRCTPSSRPRASRGNSAWVHSLCWSLAHIAVGFSLCAALVWAGWLDTSVCGSAGGSSSRGSTLGAEAETPFGAEWLPQLARSAQPRKYAEGRIRAPVREWDSAAPWPEAVESATTPVPLHHSAARGVSLSSARDGEGRTTSSMWQAWKQFMEWRAQAFGQNSAKQRRLASSTSSLSGDCGSSGSTHAAAEHAGHQQDALLFMFNALLIGTVILHVTVAVPKLQHLQQTVTLFILGVMYSLVQEGLGIKDDLGVLGRSYSMWMDIDPHMLLFAFLPALLAGDAMTIDTMVARRVANQCLYLAGPGVLFNAFATAGFLKLYLPYDWPFLLCLVTGTILAATDPVAVVSLLKELGAPPALTITIQGESLLNDGTAIVMYTLAYNMLRGITYDPGDMLIFLVRSAGGACGLGWLMGSLFCTWIRAACKRLEHNSTMIQISLTLCCAYWTFIVAEGVMQISGVLATVTASLVLADRMWPAIVNKHTLVHVWHMLEYLGNTLIFFLAGALTGNSMIRMHFTDYLHLIVLYLALMTIRGICIFASRPLLRLLSPDGREVSPAECAIMTWGGLRGAVGLALAIQVNVHKADGQISADQADRVLFFTGGIAALTLVVNATTSPAIVRFLGLAQTPVSKTTMLLRLNRQLAVKVSRKAKSKSVQDVLETLLGRIARHIAHGAGITPDDLDNPEPSKGTPALSSLSSFSARFRRNTRQSIATITNSVQKLLACKEGAVREGMDIVEAHQEAKAFYEQSPSKTLEAMKEAPKVPFQSEERELIETCSHGVPDSEMQRATNQMFLSLVKSEYWHQVEAGEFIEGTNHADSLLMSVTYAVPLATAGLLDFHWLIAELELDMDDFSPENWPLGGVEQRESEERSPRSNPSVFKKISSQKKSLKKSVWLENLSTKLDADEEEEKTFLQKAADSYIFQGVSMFAITLNLAFIMVEDEFRADDDSSSVWIIMEFIFTTYFTFEFLLKLCALKLAYFRDGWNIFDFILVLLGAIGLVIEFMMSQEKSASTAELSSQARIIRVNRVFRVMRILRAFRLIKLIKVIRLKLLRQDLSFELAEQLRVVSILIAFAGAHCRSQVKFLKYFGEDGKFSTVEQARTILESQTLVYTAIAWAVKEAMDLDEVILKGINTLRESNRIAEELNNFVCEAHEAGVISGREAEDILAPLRGQRKIWNEKLKKSAMGVKNAVSKRLTGIFPETEPDKKQKSAVDPSEEERPRAVRIVTKDSTGSADGSDNTPRHNEIECQHCSYDELEAIAEELPHSHRPKCPSSRDAKECWSSETSARAPVAGTWMPSAVPAEEIT